MKRSLCVLAWISLLAAQAASAGVFYSALNRTEGAEGSAADWQVDAWIDGDNGKIEFTSSGNPMMPAGAYLLTHDGGQNVYMVNPAEGTYARWDIEAMLEAAGSALDAAGGLVSLTIENARVQVLAEEPGDTIVGRPTTYYSYRTSYDTRIKIMGMKRAQSTVTNQEVWSTELKNQAAFGMWLRKAPPSFGDSGLDELIRIETEKIKGFPLKMVTEQIVQGKKRSQTTRSVMEVTELREESIAGKTFVLDPDLVETPMPVFGVPGDDEEQTGGLRSLLKGRRRDG